MAVTERLVKDEVWIRNVGASVVKCPVSFEMVGHDGRKRRVNAGCVWVRMEYQPYLDPSSVLLQHFLVSVLPISHPLSLYV